jgi:ribosome-associated heat shock protein Hsp15
VVISIPKSRVGAKLVIEFIRETTAKEEMDKLNLVLQMNKVNHALGIKGRPTKKDRRDLDGFMES